MRATDITWGGEAKCEFRIDGAAPVMEIGAIVKLEYDKAAKKFLLFHGNSRYHIIATSINNKAILEEYLGEAAWQANLIRVIDIQENIFIIQLQMFYSIIDFNELQKLTIKITDNVIQKIPDKWKKDPIKFISEEFIYNKNIIFATNFESKVKLQVISKGWRLDIDRKGNEYLASNIRRDSSEIKNLVYMLRGSLEFIESTQNSNLSKEITQKLQVIANPDSYFAIWEAYNELETLMLYKDAVEGGIAEYSSYEVEVKDAFIYKFKLKDNSLENFNSEEEEMDCTEDPRIKSVDKWEELGEIKNLKTYSVGKFIKIINNVLFIIDRNSESKKKLPKSGFLFKSVSGDSARIQRRNDAKEDISKGIAAIPNLSILIDSGTSNTRQYKSEQAITNRLKDSMKKNLGKTVEFNEAQRKAIEVALNTPDIALIQGPPGTGKTTVIKAIIARFEEYFQKNNEGEIPKILVTSFQHEAVDNAISNMNPSGLPPNRMGGRRGEESKQNIAITAWINKEVKRCEEIINKDGNPSIYQKINIIEDEYFSWYSQGKDINFGIDLLIKIIGSHQQEISYELRSSMDAIISRAKVDNSKLNKTNEIRNVENEIINQIVGKQRITKKSFDDDGMGNALELRFAVEGGIFKDEVVPVCLLKTITSKGENENEFLDYIKYVIYLQEKYALKLNDSIKKKLTSTEIEACIDQALNELKTNLLSMRENKDEAKAQILQNYKDAISNEIAAKRIINRYSNINAATCQQAMILGKNAERTNYDLVIVDEAARANPLDLFIPMSMGKQVILVGDHKQLPHMLEPDIVNRLNKDEKLKELDILGKSLFERLYGIFERQKLNGNINRTCQLDLQFRMHPLISEFVSNAFYDGNLKTELAEEDRTLNSKLYNNKPIVWIDACKQRFGIEDYGKSKYREKEAMLLFDNLIKVLNENEGTKVGIITFYARQKELLEELAEARLTSDELDRIEIGTVDSFQGKEFDIVFLSCVRSNNEKDEELRRKVGFLFDTNRLCVSLSRAKSLLIIVGDSETICIIPTLKKLFDLCKSGRGEYINA